MAIAWKQAIIIPIPKLGCLDGYDQFLYHVSLKAVKGFFSLACSPNQKSNTSFSLCFQKGKGTQMCSAQYLTEFKEAFVRASPPAVLYELTLLRVKGKILLLKRDYLSLKRTEV